MRQKLITGGNSSERTRLARSSVLIAGLGGLGSAAALYLTAAGVGRLVLCDGDHVEASNLNRQIIYNTTDIGCSKAIIAKERLQLLNPSVEFVSVADFLTPASLPFLLDTHQVVLDCLDNLSDKLILNQQCVKNNIPLMHGAVEGFSGQMTFIVPGVTPCLNCWFGENRQHRVPTPVLGPVAGVIGSFMAAETLKYLSGNESAYCGSLLILRSDGAFQAIRGKRCSNCSDCGSKGT